MLNGLTFIPSVTDTGFLLILKTVSGASHLPDLSLNTLKRSPGKIRYFVASGILIVVPW